MTQPNFAKTGRSGIRVIASPAFKGRERQPYNHLLYTHLTEIGAKVAEFSPSRVLNESFDVWHLHWPDATWNRKGFVEAFVRAIALLLLIDLARYRGIRIVWTVHNLHAHDVRHPRLESWFWAKFARRVDGYLSLTESGQRAAIGAFPALASRPAFVVPHGDYRGSYPNRIDRRLARRRLGITEEARVVLFAGNIFAYKNVPQLIRAFKEVASIDSKLVIAGRPADAQIEADVIEEANDHPGIRLDLSFIANDELQVYFRACDLVVLPFRDILNSGSAILALSFDRPILVPDRGVMGELQHQVGERWVRLYSGELSADTLQDALDHAASISSKECVDLSPFRWSGVAQKTLDAYLAIVHAEQKT
jgi:beta-1,4-mannosyltransferase